MRHSILITVIFLISFSSHAQLNLDVSGIYFQRATNYYVKANLEQAKIYLDRGVRYDSTINESSVARIGTLINYDLKDYKSAQVYAKRYFDLNENKRSRQYKTMRNLFIKINRLCREISIEEDQQKFKKLVFEKEQRQLNALK